MGFVSFVVIIEFGVNMFLINKINYGIEFRFFNFFVFKRE